MVYDSAMHSASHISMDIVMQSLRVYKAVLKKS